jgi:phosphoribosylglycinamide formyltransferase-1
MKKVGVLISGRGSNLQALLESARAGQLGGEVAVVVSNVASAAGSIAREPRVAAHCGRAPRPHA